MPVNIHLNKWRTFCPLVYNLSPIVSHYSSSPVLRTEAEVKNATSPFDYAIRLSLPFREQDDVTGSHL